MKDFYKILEIHPDASLEVMNNAYRALVRKYHPDLFHTRHKNQVESRMQEINEAYQVLSNPITRAEYDRRYRRAPRTEPRSSAPDERKPAAVIRRMLFWGLGTYILLKFLLAPLMASPAVKALVLGLILLIVFRLYVKGKTG